jgi:hypothetical protein
MPRNLVKEREAALAVEKLKKEEEERNKRKQLEIDKKNAFTYDSLRQVEKRIKDSLLIIKNKINDSISMIKMLEKNIKDSAFLSSFGLGSKIKDDVVVYFNPKDKSGLMCSMIIGFEQLKKLKDYKGYFYPSNNKPNGYRLPLYWELDYVRKNINLLPNVKFDDYYISGEIIPGGNFFITKLKSKKSKIFSGIVTDKFSFWTSFYNEFDYESVNYFLVKDFKWQDIEGVIRNND